MKTFSNDQIHEEVIQKKKKMQRQKNLVLRFPSNFFVVWENVDDTWKDDSVTRDLNFSP